MSAALKVAIIGSGPSGCYVAERLLRQRKGAIEVDVFDRLPTPFGLVRGGVAPDHQSTKAIARVLGRAIAQDGCRFFGNVHVGRDLSLDQLRSAYDAVVLAVGAPRDRRLRIAGEDLAGVFGSSAFVGWYNGHPDYADLAPALDRVRQVVIIGNGNVAVDVARVLARCGSEMDRSDIDPEVEAAIAAAPLHQILIAGRRGAADVRFTPVELAELGDLQQAAVVVSEAQVMGTEAADNPSTAVLREFAARPAQPRPITIAFGFRLVPEAFLGDEAGRLRGVRFRREQGVLEVPAELVVTCVGYEAVACDTLFPEHGAFSNDAGRVDDGLYVVGWAGRGASGTIATNRPESHALADRILAEVTPAGRPGRAGVTTWLQGTAVVDFGGWQRIEAAETARAGSGRPRRKFTSMNDLVAVAEVGSPQSKSAREGTRMNLEQFKTLMKPITDAVSGRALDASLVDTLNREVPADGPAFKAIENGCHEAIAAGWMCTQGGPGRRFGRVIEAGPETHGLSVDVVHLQDVVGPHHRHPTGEICMIMPVTATAKFDGCGRGWMVNEPDSAHHPTVTEGEALVLYLLPDGKIEFTR
ncbi:MAG: DUF4863 family protein [Rhodospirillales bacterium]|nr:DUF4863 family protein [Rhodospirillales bacterium]